MKKKLLSALLAFALSLGTATIPAAAAEVDSAGGQVSAQLNTVSLNGRTSSNVDRHIYNVWSKPVRSYLTEKADGTLERVEYDSENGKLFYEWYSSDGKTLKKSAEITNELELFGGFYSGSSNNFLVFGQNNYSEDNSREVMRVVKYTKDWKRISSASVKGENTYIPFDAGSLRMAEYAGDLYIHTSHEMYESADGLHHQSNMSFVMHENNMTIERWHSGYVSHSFNQFIKEDGKGVYRVDHGDAYPRAIAINKYLTSDALWNSIETEAVDLSNTGDIGDNVTGASVGGFELSGNNCIIAFNAVDFERKDVNVYDTRNIWLSVTDKNLSSSRNIKITDYSADSSKEITTPQLVKINDNRFLLMWEEFDNNTVYTKLAVVNADGKMDSQGIVTSDVTLSDCQPILCKDGLVRWYAGFGKNPVLYTVNPSALSQSANSKGTPKDIEEDIYLNLGDKIELCSKEYSADKYGHDWISPYAYRRSIYYCIHVHKPAPKLISALPSVSGGIRVKWQADKDGLYSLLRKNSDGKWESVGMTYNYDGGSELSFTDWSAENGKTYTYTVQELDPNVSGEILSGYDTKGVSAICREKPVITKTESTADGVKLTWEPFADAKFYHVYARRWDGEIDYDYTTSATSYTVKNLTPGVQYSVQVCAVDEYGYYGTWSNQISAVYVARPTLSLSNNSAGLTATWSSSGADSYVVYYRPAERSTWSSFSTTASKAVIPNTESGKLYCVQVQNVSGGKKGAYSKVKSMTYLSRAAISSVSYNGNNALQWNAVGGANQYQIARKKTGDTAYTYYTTADAGFSEQNITAGTTYTYQVRAMYKTEKNGTAYGAWSSSKSVVTIEKPELRLSNKNNGVRLEWNAAKGAVKYVVYYKKAGDKSWSSTTTANTYYPYLNVTGGQQYYFQLRAIGQNLNGPYSEVKSMTYLARANLTTLTYNGSNTLQWSAVDGANQYQIARKKTGDKAYTYYTTTETGFAEQNVTAGTTYTYQVRAMYKTEKNGTAYGAWSSSKSVVTIEKPELRLSNKKNGVRLEWNAAKGAVKYVVYYKKAGDKSWSSTTTANTYYPYLNVTEGQQYYFQLRAIGQNLNGPYSKVQTKVFYNPYKQKPAVALSRGDNSLNASWNAIDGATQYIVYYRRNDTAQWSSTQVADCNFVYPDAVKGTTYCVQVQPVFGSAKGVYSKVQRITC